MKGSQGIPALHLTTLNKLISKMDKAPNNFFTSLFKTSQYPSDTIEWEIEYASGGMTPFVAPGSVAPSVGIDGVSKGSAKAAYWKEKMFFDEEFLNNLREPGRPATYQTAQRHLAKGLRKLRFRCERRREWMMAKAFTTGAISYLMTGGTKIAVSYGIPDRHLITLDEDRRWDGGSARNPLEDIFDAKKSLQDDAGVTPIYSICNSNTIKTLMFDANIQALLKKSAFGEGDLFANPAKVVGELLGVGVLRVYDEMFEIQGWVTNITSLTFTVDDASDFEVGGTARVVIMNKYNTWYDYLIASVDKVNSTVTVTKIRESDPNPDSVARAGRDKIVMRRKFIDDHTFSMFSDVADGEKVAEFMESPFGLSRTWGMFVDTKEEWDPDGIWIRVQNKGLPVIYNPDTSITLVVSSATPIDEYS